MRIVALIAAFMIVSPASVFAEQYSRGGQVVHTRLAPVIMHKAVPPFRGAHTFQGRGRR